MPELPEVETTCRGIAPYVIGHKIIKLAIHQRQMRWPIPKKIDALKGSVVNDVSRRGKYIQLHVDEGEAIIHLGMSGSLRISDPSEAKRKHDHVEWFFDNGKALRLHDPRRFGCVLWHEQKSPTHPLLEKLGPEPLGNEFTADYLFAETRKRKAAIKVFIMNSHVVVGVGNISNLCLWQGFGQAEPLAVLRGLNVSVLSTQFALFYLNPSNKVAPHYVTLLTVMGNPATSNNNY